VMPMKKQPKSIAPWEVTADMFLSEAESESLLDHVRSRERTAADNWRVRATVDRLIIELLLFSGLRNSEVCHLRVVDARSELPQSAIRVVGTPKQDRLVYIPRELCEFIAQFVKSVRPECALSQKSGGVQREPLILNERGKSYDRTALYR